MAIIEFPIPTIITNIRAFLGLTKYYRNYVKKIPILLLLCLSLQKKDITFVWMPHCQDAFNMLKDALVKVPILIKPDFTKPCCVGCRLFNSGSGCYFVTKGR